MTISEHPKKKIAVRGKSMANIEMGEGAPDKRDDSGPARCTFEEHGEYFDATLDALDTRENATLLVHDWGARR
jgi:hypothetical protein